MKKIILFCLILFLALACTKPNEEKPKKPENENVGGRKVVYTVMVLKPDGESWENSKGIDSAVVSLVMNDSVYNKATDAKGIAKFANLASGIVAVKITHPKYATTSMMVDISARDSSEKYDSKNIRNAATMVSMLPTEGENMATISGKALAELDLTNTDFEFAPEGIQISSYIEQKQLLKYVNQKGDGQIISISCQSKTQKTTTGANGGFSIKVPASQTGLKVVLVADDFAHQQISSSGTKRHVYKAIYDTVSVVSGMKHVADIKYK